MNDPRSTRGLGTRVSDFDYELPDELIARYPTPRREESRLLVLDRTADGLRHLRFSDLPGLMAPGDAVVVNESRVLPVRLLGRKPTGAPAEILLIRPVPEHDDESVWEALVRPGGKLAYRHVSREAGDHPEPAEVLKALRKG